MPAQVNFGSDNASHRETSGMTSDGGNGNLGVDVLLRNDASGYRLRRYRDCNDITNGSHNSSSSSGSSSSSSSSGSATSGISCGIRIGRPTLVSWASSMASSLPSFHDTAPSAFAVVPSYRAVGTQTDDDDGAMYDDDKDYDDFDDQQCLSDDVSDEVDDEDVTGLMSLNSSSRSENESFSSFPEDFDYAARCCSSCSDSTSGNPRDNDNLNGPQVTNFEITLNKATIDEKIGLTLFYRTYFDDSTCAFVGEVDPDGLAAKDGRIQRGDQIIKVDGVELESREQALQMFGTSRLGVTLSVVRGHHRSRCPSASLGQSSQSGQSSAAECQPPISIDDGFLDDPAFLDRHQPFPVPPRRLPHPSFYMLAKTLECIDEEDADDNEDATTDDTTDFSGSNRQEDSGVGRTDDSTRNEESSEQELPDIDGGTSLGSVGGGGKRSTRLDADQCSEWRHCVDNEDRGDTSVADEDDHHEVVYEGPSPIQCQQFYAMLKERCNAGLLRKGMTPASSKADGYKGAVDRNDRTLSSAPPIPPRSVKPYAATEVCSRRGFVFGADAGCCPATGICGSSATTAVVSRRPVPRMGTRIDATATSSSSSGASRPVHPVQLLPCQQEVTNQPSSSLHLSSLDERRSIDVSLQSPNRALRRCVAAVVDTDSSPSSTTTVLEKRPPPLRSQPETLASKRHNPVVDVDRVAAIPAGTDRAEAYRRSGADVMLTNRANLRHTIALQQTLFQQQMVDNGRGGKLTPPPPPALACPSSSSSSSEKIDQPSHVLFSRPAPATSTGLPPMAVRPTDLPLSKSISPPQHQRQIGDGNTVNPSSISNADGVAGETGVKMEWVVKRRSDGTRYVTRRPVKTTGSSGRRSTRPPSSGAVRDSRPKVRCREAAEQRWAAAAATSRREVACSTDDDDGSSVAISELKAGRYWTREQRRQHVEQRRERQALKQHKRAEAAAAAEAATRPAMLERTTATAVHTSLTVQKYRCAASPCNNIDDFVTVDEIMARGSRGTSGRQFNDRNLAAYHSEHQQQLLSVTTV